MMKRYLAIVLSLAVCSCTKTESLLQTDNSSGEPILFSISDDIQLRGIVEDADDLVYNATSNPNTHVYVYGTKDGSAISDSKYACGELTYKSSSGLWDVASPAAWEYDNTNNRGYLYEFSAFAVSGIDSSVVVKTKNNFGLSFPVSQPSSYPSSTADFKDYLLSNLYSVTSIQSGSSARGDVVRLHMEHAMSAVRVIVQANSKLYRTGILGIKLDNFYRTATMYCSSQAAYGSGVRNKWTTLYPDNNGTTYLRGDVSILSSVSESNFTSNNLLCTLTSSNNSQKIMDCIVIPQDASSSTLTISYIVQEQNGSTVHQAVMTWDLSQYDGWESGCRNTYIITIDTSNSLYAVIDDWTDGGSIQGVILP